MNAGLLHSALTEIKEPSTKASPMNTEAWARWLDVDMRGLPSIRSMVTACASFLVAFRGNQTPRWITLMGKTGVGKTHCARRVWDYAQRNANWSRSAYSPRLVYWPRFVSSLRAGTAFDLLRDMMVWPVLFIDDIGAERDASGFATEQLNTLLGCRSDRWTILTSNLSLEMIAQVEPRIADRIIRAPNLFVEVDAPSYALAADTRKRFA